MGKSILMIDTPECCDYCPAGRIFGMAGQVECRATETLHVNPDGRTVPDWCPLQDVRQIAQYLNVVNASCKKKTRKRLGKKD